MGLLDESIASGKRAFVLIGESGSGKTEIALNWAFALAAGGHRVRFFDMDQTKPIFRSRERAALLAERGIAVETPRQLLDAPTVPDAVFDKVRDPDFVSVLDVGGNENGARALAQFRGAWEDRVLPCAVVNWHRVFHDGGALVLTMERAAAAASFPEFAVISNPNLGPATTIEEAAEGHERTVAALRSGGYEARALVALAALAPELARRFPGIEVSGLSRYMRAPWEQNIEEE